MLDFSLIFVMINHEISDLMKGGIIILNTRRRNAILQYINEHKHVYFSELYLTFDVSPATMRRDLTALEQKNLIRRFHGGAESIQSETDSSAFPTIDHRIDRCVSEKKDIAHYSLQFIQDGSSIILDASTTCLHLAQAIKKANLHLTVITNYFKIANTLLDSETIDMLFIGGYVRKGYSSTSGIIAEDNLMDMNADIGFIGVDGITPEKGLSNNRLDVIEWKKLILKNSRVSYVLADHTKFDTAAILQIAPLSDITNIITDEALSDDILNRFGEEKRKIIRLQKNADTKKARFSV